MSQENKQLFCPNASQIDSTFWGSFCKLKLDVLGLNEEPISISGQYGPNEIPNLNPVILVDHSSFTPEVNPYHGMVKVPGLLINTNTAEQFKQIDKNDLMKSMGSNLIGKLWSDDGLKEISQNPAILGSFFILTFADLKKYKFIYWFGFPAVTSITVEKLSPYQPVSEHFEKIECFEKIFANGKDIVNTGFFIIRKGDGNDGISLKALESIDEISSGQIDDILFGYLDPSSLQDPGWILRNYVAFIVRKLKLPTDSILQFLSYRPKRSSQLEKSYIVRIKITYDDSDFDTNTKYIGWERSSKGTFGPKHVDLQMSMNPEKLAESSVDLNLKLMKWRLFPDFNLEMMHETKCLILGAGTLGCNVARGLMGWGIRNIVFVDNGKVSYSNPARQSLYTFQDCVDGGRNKSQAAAENLKSIFPGMVTRHQQIMIPMPGHPTSEATVAEVKAHYEILIKEVQECDVMFLLLDTRESRWLPTVLGQKYQKIVINAALGFDSYLVMRHGARPTTPIEQSKTLGCYFCTDIVAPGDSTRDRTLDQQCTVTRPGVSMIAGALAVEMMTAVLHHPDRNLAKASATEADVGSPLGIIPHSIRGFLSTGQTIMPSFQAFDKCTACSEKIIQEFDSREFQFVLDVLNEPSEFLEKLTGLNLLKDEFDLEGIVELSDSEEDRFSTSTE